MSPFIWCGREYYRPWDRRWSDPNTDAIVEVMTRPTAEPLTIEEARAQLRLTATGSPLEHPDDDWIEDFGIGAAREYCEWQTGRAYAPQTFRLTLDRFPYGNAASSGRWHPRAGIRLPFAAPLIAVVSVDYTDVDGVPQALVEGVDYVVQSGYPARIFPISGATWPTVDDIPGAVLVEYQAGYGDIGSPAGPLIPMVALTGIRLMLGHLYENREATTTDDKGLVEIPLGIRNWLQPINLNTGFA